MNIKLCIVVSLIFSMSAIFGMRENAITINFESNTRGSELVSFGAKCFLGGGLGALGVVVGTKLLYNPIIKPLINRAMKDITKNITGKKVQKDSIGEEIIDFAEEQVNNKIDNIYEKTIDPKIKDLRKKIDDQVDLLIKNLKNDVTDLKIHLQKTLINSENKKIDESLLKVLTEEVKNNLTEIKNHTQKTIIKSNNNNKDSLLEESVESLDKHINKLVEQRLNTLLLGTQNEEELKNVITEKGILEALIVKLNDQTKKTTKDVTEEFIETTKKNSRLIRSVLNCDIL